MFKNYHEPHDWKYEHEGKTYIKVGAYGTDDMEVSFPGNGGVYIEDVETYYKDIDTAYDCLNRLWIKHEEQGEKNARS